jgi:hypothetical protein
MYQYSLVKKEHLSPSESTTAASEVSLFLLLRSNNLFSFSIEAFGFFSITHFFFTFEQKFLGCVTKTAEKIKGTPCEAIQQLYSDCLATKKSRLNCRTLKLTLEECTAKHIGKLD